MIRAAVAVVQYEGCVLVGKRPQGTPLAEQWEFPGGKILPGESPLAAAARECLEETGLTVEVRSAYPEVTHDYDHGRVRVQFFACTPVEPVGEPALPFVWIPVRQLAKYEFPAANRELVEQLVRESIAN